jgi:hypothetical protein
LFSGLTVKISSPPPTNFLLYFVLYFPPTFPSFFSFFIFLFLPCLSLLYLSMLVYPFKFSTLNCKLCRTELFFTC